MHSAARELLLHPLVRGGSYGLAVAFLVQSFFDSWKWWIFALWAVVFIACALVARRDLVAGRIPAARPSPSDDAELT